MLCEFLSQKNQLYIILFYVYICKKLYMYMNINIIVIWASQVTQ